MTFAHDSNQTLRDPFLPSAMILQEPSAMPTQLVALHYADATMIANFLKNNHVISSSGQVAADVRTNQLWITEQSNRMSALIRLIRHLDIPISQVLIKARIVSVDNDFLHSLGILFNVENANAPSTTDNLVLDFPTMTPNTGAINFPILRLHNGHLLDLTLTALEQEGHITLISSPQLMTNTRQTATIESGEEVPYQEKTGEGNTSVAFKKATLRLEVTPTVLPENRILLQLTVNQDKISSLIVNGVPAIRTQQLTTTVWLKNRETVVLGGIYEEMGQHEEIGVPGLRKIPLMGGLFRQKQRATARKQLLIFVTPQIISEKRLT